VKPALNKQAVARSFSEAAADYDQGAQAQRRIADAVAALLPEPACLPEGGILELGCGTGLLTRHLAARYPGRPILALDLAPGMIDACRARMADAPQVRFVAADAEASLLADQLAADGPWALAAASCTFQWFADPAAVIERIARRWLAPGGALALGAMLEGSLAELADSFHFATGRPMPALDLWDADRYRDAFLAAGLRPRIERVESIVVSDPDALTAVGALRRIGATFRRQPGYRPLSPMTLRRLAAHYQTHHGDGAGGVRTTYRTLLALAQRES
jgi:malonyl-CoA O-methyltransferase